MKTKELEIEADWVDGFLLECLFGENLEDLEELE